MDIIKVIGFANDNTIDKSKEVLWKTQWRILIIISEKRNKFLG